MEDPFLFPVTYAHTFRPDYALTYKFSSDDYGDLRRWSGTEWEWWDDEDELYIPTSGTWVGGIDIHSTWISKADGFVDLRIPIAFLEGHIPAEIRFQVYLTQEAEIKRSAFDSSPHDLTLDLDFDLKVYNSSGTQVGYSGSWDNSYEIAEFTASPGQTYDVRIRRWSGSSDTWYGIAWTMTGPLSYSRLAKWTEQPLSVSPSARTAEWT